MPTSFCSPLLLVVSLASACTPGALLQAPHEIVLPYTAPRQASCLTRPQLPAASPARTQGMVRAQQALAEGRDTLSSSFWDFDKLDNPRDMTLLLRLYSIDKRALKLKHIKLAGKNATAVHQELLAHGFYHKRVALEVDPGEDPKRYWQRNGQSTTDPRAPDLAPLDLYTYNDGSLVKVKPEGIPDASYQTPRPQPQLSLSVLRNLEKLCDADNRCELDTSYDNEAFMVSFSGLPIPKSPSPGLGFRPLYREDESLTDDEASRRRDENAGWTATIMAAAQIDLPTDYTHCK